VERDVFSIENQQLRVTFNVRDIAFDGNDCKLIIMKDVTSQYRLQDAENKT
jgi:hypothetical protein